MEEQPNANDVVKPRALPNGASSNGYSGTGTGPRKAKAPGKASGEVRKGKCPNVRGCPNGGSIVEVAKGDPFACPDCGCELLPEPKSGGRRGREIVILLAIVATFGLLGAGVFWVLSSHSAGKAVATGQKVEALPSPPPPPPERKPPLAEAEAALRKALPQGMSLVSLSLNEAVKNPDGSWSNAYAATIMSEKAQYWVPVVDLDAAKLTKRLDEIPSPERAWARRHLKDLVLTEDQAPGQQYLFDEKKPLAAVTPGTAFPFMWRAVASEQPGGAWRFVPTTPLPFAQPPQAEANTESRVVRRSEPELQQAQTVEEQRWQGFVDRLKRIEQEAKTNYRQVLANAPSPGKKPNVFRAGSGGPTTMAEGAGIGAGGGALAGAMFGGGEGAAIGAGVGALLGATGGGIFSHHRQEELYRERQAERRRNERAAEAARERAREQLLSQYADELKEEAEQRHSQLAGVVREPSASQAADGYAIPTMHERQSYGPPPPPWAEPPSGGLPQYGSGSPQPPSSGLPPPN